MLIVEVELVPIKLVARFGNLTVVDRSKHNVASFNGYEGIPSLNGAGIASMRSLNLIGGDIPVSFKQVYPIAKL